jgi:hypothetical protein
MKIVPTSAEKRLKRFAPSIKHDEAQYQHAFRHCRPWYRKRSAISAPTGLPMTGVLRPENAVLFRDVDRGGRGRIGEIAANLL